MNGPNMLNYQEQNRLNGERESAELQSNAIFNTIYESSVAVCLTVLYVLSNGATCGKGVRELIFTSIMIRAGFLAPLNTLFHCLVKKKSISPSLVGMINSLIGLPFAGWYIFITVRFFDEND
mmetsp:Transcript_6376/g.7329  ORF Transcript_6376/g.7329 Transcript_6376/m.7329 type:complete len:122 (-) Transcript_6376:497-862(-)